MGVWLSASSLQFHIESLPVHWHKLHYPIITSLSDEEGQEGARDFNNAVLSVTFPSSADELEVEVTESFIFDDDMNEVNEEGFVIVLEIEQSDQADSVTLTEGRDVLVFYIFDNDGM